VAPDTQKLTARFDELERHIAKLTKRAAATAHRRARAAGQVGRRTSAQQVQEPGRAAGARDAQLFQTSRQNVRASASGLMLEESCGCAHARQRGAAGEPAAALPAVAAESGDLEVATRTRRLSAPKVPAAPAHQHHSTGTHTRIPVLAPHPFLVPAPNKLYRTQR
jgi:hypothetical protein